MLILPSCTFKSGPRSNCEAGGYTSSYHVDHKCKSFAFFSGEPGTKVPVRQDRGLSSPARLRGGRLLIRRRCGGWPRLRGGDERRRYSADTGQNTTVGPAKYPGHQENDDE